MALARSFPMDSLDGDAVSVVTRLQREGYTAYLVGGCVRDLLLGGTPKDFDIATSALPEELREVFGRRCRLIGRRFKLAHIRAGAKIFEVATFRGPPEDQDTEDDSGFVVRANNFGTPEQDAQSRDFTMNGLFYDPVAGTIIDFVGGSEDIAAGRIKTIGDAEQRFREDPVRLLRAVKFAARIGLELDQDIIDAAPITAPLIHDCPVARVTEEIFRVLETGHAERTIAVLRRLGVIDVVLPEVAGVLDESDSWDAGMAWLAQVDRVVRAHDTLPRESTFVLLTWPLISAVITSQEDAGRLDWGRLTADLIQEGTVRMAVPIRHRQLLRAVANIMRRLRYPNRRTRRAALLRAPALPVALALLRIEWLMGGDPSLAETYEDWAEALQRFRVTAAPVEPRLEETGFAHEPDAGRRPGRGGRQQRED